MSLIFPISMASPVNLTLVHQHPYPDAVSEVVHLRDEHSLSRIEMLSLQLKNPATCLTGNPINECWRCDQNWYNNRQRLADCSIGFGQDAMGGKGGQIYTVTDSSDSNPANPTQGTLRYAVIQEEPLWIIFAGHTTINHLNQPRAYLRELQNHRRLL